MILSNFESHFRLVVQRWNSSDRNSQFGPSRLALSGKRFVAKWCMIDIPGEAQVKQNYILQVCVSTWSCPGMCKQCMNFAKLVCWMCYLHEEDHWQQLDGGWDPQMEIFIHFRQLWEEQLNNLNWSEARQKRELCLECLIIVTVIINKWSSHELFKDQLLSGIQLPECDCNVIREGMVTSVRCCWFEEERVTLRIVSAPSFLRRTRECFTISQLQL